MDDLSGIMGAITATCTNAFRVVGEVFPTAKVHSVIKSLVEKLVQDPRVGLERVVTDLLQRDDFGAGDYLDALCSVQQKW